VGSQDVAALRGIAVAGLAALFMLLVLAIEAQPAFDLRRDLVSGLAARGAASPLLAQGAIAALALAHLAIGAALLMCRLRVAGVAGAVAAVCLVGVAAVQITCPRGARGCSGPESGRSTPRPVADVVHRNLVAVFELASVVLAVAVAVFLLREAGRRTLGSALLAAAVVSPAVLLRQQSGVDIGWYQLAWVVTTCAIVLGVVAALRPSRGRASSSGRCRTAARRPR
jgi:hypothetical protein